MKERFFLFFKAPTKSKKFMLVISFLILCSMRVIAQTGYYYKGEKIPLIMNDNKVCMSIPKDMGKTSRNILESVNAIDKIADENFDIFIVQQPDLKLLSASDSWSEETVLFTPCYKTMAGIEVFSTPYLNVRLKAEQDITLLSEYAKKYELEIVKKDPLMPLWYILSVSPETGKNAIEVANTLWESGLFAASVPDLYSDDELYSNDPMFDQQWGLYNSSYTNVDISVRPAWDYATGKNVNIGILDTGVDMSHIDLASNISNLSYDTETNTSPSIYYRDHATHCAGIAAAVKDNGIQIAGVAPDAKIVSISNSLMGTTNSRLKRADGIIWAYQHGVDIISNSWGSSTYHAAIDEAIQDAFKYGRNGKGCVIVFAAGNDQASTISYPANCNDTILVVGAIDNTGMKAPFSNYGTGLDIVAPGVSILSTLPNNQTGYKNGTSMACPHVAGVAALILERNPELSVNQVTSIINGNAKKLSGVDFNISKTDGLWNDKYGYGLLDAYNAVINTPTVIYIQNETITGNKVISADSIYIGKDVTDKKEYGNVTLGQGQITLKAKLTKIKNSTSVPLGTTLKIENQ